MPARISGTQSRPLISVIIQKPKKLPTFNAVAEGVRSTAHHSVKTLLSEISLPHNMMPYFLTLAWKDRPQYSQLWDTRNELTFTDSLFGSIPKGSILSYQQKKSDSVLITTEISQLPLMIYPDLSSFLTCYLPLIKQLALVHDSLFVTEAPSRDYEELTRAQADCDD